jgi:hypothetical protein
MNQAHATLHPVHMWLFPQRWSPRNYISMDTKGILYAMYSLSIELQIERVGEKAAEYVEHNLTFVLNTCTHLYFYNTLTHRKNLERHTPNINSNYLQEVKTHFSFIQCHKVHVYVCKIFED